MTARRTAARRTAWALPLVLFAIGIALFFGGIGWAVATGVAIPYQDPTPEMQGYEAFHFRIVDPLMYGGMLFVFVAAVWSVLLLARRAWRKWVP